MGTPAGLGAGARTFAPLTIFVGRGGLVTIWIAWPEDWDTLPVATWDTVGGRRTVTWGEDDIGRERVMTLELPGVRVLVFKMALVNPCTGWRTTGTGCGTNFTSDFILVAGLTFRTAPLDTFLGKASCFTTVCTIAGRGCVNPTEASDGLMSTPDIDVWWNTLGLKAFDMCIGFLSGKFETKSGFRSAATFVRLSTGLFRTAGTPLWFVTPFVITVFVFPNDTVPLFVDPTDTSTVGFGTATFGSDFNRIFGGFMSIACCVVWGKALVNVRVTTTGPTVELTPIIWDCATVSLLPFVLGRDCNPGTGKRALHGLPEWMSCWSTRCATVTGPALVMCASPTWLVFSGANVLCPEVSLVVGDRSFDSRDPTSDFIALSSTSEFRISSNGFGVAIFLRRLTPNDSAHARLALPSGKVFDFTYRFRH